MHRIWLIKKGSRSSRILSLNAGREMHREGTAEMYRILSRPNCHQQAAKLGLRSPQTTSPKLERSVGKLSKNSSRESYNAAEVHRASCPSAETPAPVSIRLSQLIQARLQAKNSRRTNSLAPRSASQHSSILEYLSARLVAAP